MDSLRKIHIFPTPNLIEIRRVERVSHTDHIGISINSPLDANTCAFFADRDYN